MAITWLGKRMSTLGSYLQSIEMLRSVEWSKTWLWDIKFEQRSDNTNPQINQNSVPSAPFDTWFPANDYSETSRTSNTLVLPFYLSQYKFLQTGSNIDINVTFHDDINGTLYNWLSDWFSYVLDDTDGVCMLDDAYRIMSVLKLNSQREPIKQYLYMVVPEGVITESLNSMPDTKTYTASFAVVGRQVVNITS